MFLNERKVVKHAIKLAAPADDPTRRRATSEGICSSGIQEECRGENQELSWTLAKPGVSMGLTEAFLIPRVYSTQYFIARLSYLLHISGRFTCCTTTHETRVDMCTVSPVVEKIF